MSKLKNNFFKRLVAFILVFLTLSSTLSIVSMAGDSVFLETLINTDKYTYVANFTSDQKAKLKKYAYKYMNLGYVFSKGCGGGDMSMNGKDSQSNPNYCITLNTNHEYGDPDYRYDLSWKYEMGDLNKDSAAINVFMLIEGYMDKSGNFINDDARRGDALAGKHSKILQKARNGMASPLSYPGYWTETVTDEQAEYGQEALISLVASLNGILQEVNDGQKFESVTEMVNKSIMIRPDGEHNIVYIKPKTATGGYNGYVILYADLQNISSGGYETVAGEANRILSEYKNGSGKSLFDITSYINISGNKVASGAHSGTILNALGVPRANTDKQLYAYVFPLDDTGRNIKVNEGSMFVYAIPKGFTDIYYEDENCPLEVHSDGNGNDICDGSGCWAKVFYKAKFLKGGQRYDYTEKQGDTPWISIHMLSMYANTVYKQNGISISTYVAPDTNVISQLIAWIFQSILWAIRGILGLTKIEVLVFNLGVRGSAAYNFGLMSENWWNVVLQYQLIFQAIAWVILVCGFIKTLINLNLSTMSGNPGRRASLYDTIQKFIVVGIGLVILIPGVQFLLECNDVIVELFASQIDTATLNMPLVTNVFVQFLVGIMWITITLYINFIYIMRSITIALLIASGPFFIATIAFSNSGKSSLFSSWFKELVSNIFIQAMHSFILSFLMQLLSTGTFLETFAIAISIIPITEMFRNLIFAGGGGSTSQLANSATSAATQMGTSALKGAVGGVGAVMAAKGGKDGGGGGAGGGAGGAGGGKGGNAFSNVMNNKMQEKVNKMQNGTSLGGKIKAASEKKTGKAGGSALAKLGGGVVDAVGISAMGMAAAIPDMIDMVQGASDLALKGDASGMGRAVEHSAYGHVSRGGGMAATAISARQDKKNRAEASGTKANAGSTQDMGGSAINSQQGSTAAGGGAAVKTEMATGSTQVSSMSTTNLSSGASGLDHSQGSMTSAKQAKALQDWRAAQKDGRATATAASIVDKNGVERHGTVFSMTDKNGKQESFFMDGATQKSVAGTSNVADAVSKGGAVADKVDNNLAKSIGKTTETDYRAAGIGDKTGYQGSELDVSDTSVANRKAALEAVDKSSASTSTDVKMTDKNGNIVDGKKFTYRADNGKIKSFMMSNSAISEAKSSKEAAAKTFNRSTDAHNGARHASTVGGEHIATSNGTEAQNARAAMAATHGHDMGAYYGADGQEAGRIYEYEGQRMAVNNDIIANKGEYISKHVESGLSSKQGLGMQQDVNAYARYLNKTYGDGSDSSHLDLSGQTSTQGIADAAMITAAGTAVTGQEGVYTLGGRTYNTGMSKQEGIDIMHSRGISGIKTNVDAGGNESSFSYVQRNAPNMNSTLQSTSHGANGHVIGRYNVGIGQQGGPKSFAADGRGGGTMTFNSQKEAARYFNKTGNMDMAREVAGVDTNTSKTYGAITLGNNGDKGFTVSFNGDALAKQGTRMELAENGKDMMVQSADASVKDIYSLKDQPLRNNNAENVGDQVDEQVKNTNTETN